MSLYVNVWFVELLHNCTLKDGLQLRKAMFQSTHNCLCFARNVFMLKQFENNE